jgi:predicted NAD-dependent protein-ADP-ribosyltransferase YbiA (DUF1768 family)
MYTLLMLKFENEYLREKLLETGDADLIEGNRWHDKFWGKCVCDKCKGAGENNLGRILKKIRDRIRDE